MALNAAAEKLNDSIQQANPAVLQMLSDQGKAIFFPHSGILGQTAAAKGKKINATIGIALEEDGSPLRLNSVASMVDLDPKDMLPYAPSFGKPELRDVWSQMMVKKNPSLAGKPLSKPVVTCALTHALSICGYLFADESSAILAPDLYWGNYRLIFSNAYGAAIKTYNTFKDGGYDLDALEAALAEGPIGKKIVILNFPNNPTGYTITENEAVKMAEILTSAAEAGNQIVTLIDDAYFGLVYEEGVMEESIFARLADAHENLLAVKIDGATKEDYVWGFRVGFITYGIKGATDELYTALQDKTAGAVRGNISNVPHISQSILLKAYTSDAYQTEKQEKYEILKRRCVKVKEILASNAKYAEVFSALPFNSGYFMCLKLKSTEPEKVRQILLSDYSTGVIAASGVIRVAFSATPYDLLEELFENIYQACLKA